MSIKKKIVFLPYDMDTALGINNEGELVFDFSLEDTDVIAGADVFNGQQSVLWNNIRDAFGDEIAEMYRTLRNEGTLSYEYVEQAFEDHQSKWPESLVNEDEDYKYIQPYVKDGTDYLGMLLGLKTEQRKWWLYNRFRYMDSKFNAGDALSDTITLRPYGVGNISITPYADIYTTVNWDGTYDSKRTTRRTTSTHICPYQTMNDNVVIIHSASQLASIGDLSPLKLGLCDVSKATRLQSLKVGDEASSYSNPNMRSMTLGNNRLLKVIDARNCVGLGDTSMQGHTQTTVDVSGCTILEEAYFDDTKIQGLTLPNGGNLKKLHLPETITNLTVLNQSKITDFQIASYANIGTLRLEGTNLDMLSILRSVYANAPSGTRIRLVGFDWRLQDAAEIESVLAIFDTMRGLDANGNNVEVKEAVIGRISTAALTGTQIASYQARYPYIEVTADQTQSWLTYATYNGEVLKTVECLNGTPQDTAPTGPARTATAQYNFAFIGWSRLMDDDQADETADDNVIADRTIYAAYSKTVRTYTATFVQDGTTLYTQSDIPYGSTPIYGGATPTKGEEGEWAFAGWSPALSGITANTTYTPVFTDLRSVVLQYLSGTIARYESDSVTNIAAYAFYGQTNLESVVASATSVGEYAFNGCTKLEIVDLTATGAVTIKGYAFNKCTGLKDLIIRSNSVATLSGTSALIGTKIASLEGGVYVPANLVASYRSNANWRHYNIASIADYPLTDFSTISDTWDEISANANYAIDYAVGDTKKLTIDGVTHYAEIVAFDEDVSKISWIVKREISVDEKMAGGSTSSITWPDSLVRTYLRETVFPTIQADVKSHIASVNKTYYTGEATGTNSVSDNVWIPSAREISLLYRDSSTDIEDSGVVYPSFNNNNQRTKMSRGGVMYGYWTRSNSGTGANIFASASGQYGSTGANGSYAIVLGFCTA